MEKWVGLCSPSVCVSPCWGRLCLTTSPLPGAGGEPACPSYLCRSTFLRATFLQVVFSSCSSDAGLGLWKGSWLGPWPGLLSDTPGDVLLLLPAAAGLLET